MMMRMIYIYIYIYINTYIYIKIDRSTNELQCCILGFYYYFSTPVTEVVLLFKRVIMCLFYCGVLLFFIQISF